MLTTQKEIRTAFWETHPDLERKALRKGVKSKGHNAQNADTRCAFVDFVDFLCRNGEIREALADRATL